MQHAGKSNEAEPHKDDRAYVSFKTKEDHAKFTWYMLKHNED